MKTLIVLRWLGVWIVVTWLFVFGVSLVVGDVVLVDQGGGIWREATPGKVFSGERVIWLTDASDPDDPDPPQPPEPTDLAGTVRSLVVGLTATDRGRQTAGAVALAYEMVAGQEGKFSAPAAMADFLKVAVAKAIDLAAGTQKSEWESAVTKIDQEVRKVDAKTPIDSTAKLAAVYRQVANGLKAAAGVQFSIDGQTADVTAADTDAINWEPFLELLLELFMKLLLEWLS